MKENKGGEEGERIEREDVEEEEKLDNKQSLGNTYRICENVHLITRAYPFNIYRYVCICGGIGASHQYS